MTRTSSGPSAGGRPSWTAVALFLLCAVVYSANGREISSADTLPTRLIPVSLIEDLRLDLDRFVQSSMPRLHEYSVQHVRGHYMSSYPIVAALLAVPIYALPIMLLGASSLALINLLAKVTATVIAAGSVVFVFLAARRLADEGAALGVSLVYALATSTWSVSSQGLWQHGPAQLFMALAVYLALSGEGRVLAHVGSVVGLAVGLMVAARPPTAIVGMTLIGYVAYRSRREGGKSILFCLAALLLTMAYNVWYFGSLEGGYAQINATHQLRHAVQGTWSTPLMQGLGGLLFSPSRGLFIYSPVLLFALAGIVHAFREPRGAPLQWLAVAWVASLLVMSKYSVWWGGHSFGPRLLADFLPVAALLLVPALNRAERSRTARGLFLGLYGLSVVVQIIGAFFYPSPRAVDWNPTPQDVDMVHGRLWDWGDTQLLRLLRNGPRAFGFGEGE